MFMQIKAIFNKLILQVLFGDKTIGEYNEKATKRICRGDAIATNKANKGTRTNTKDD